MNSIRLLENRTGVRWTGIRFHREAPSPVRKAARPMYFCEAVNASCVGPVTLTPALINCPGALRSFGWRFNGDAALPEKWIRQTGLSAGIAGDLLERSPQIKKDAIAAVTVGTYVSPDILVAYLQPESAMRFVLQWQNANRANLDISVSSIMAVCGNVVAEAYNSGCIQCSFGCCAAHARGIIGRDRLIFGMPAGLIDTFL